MFIIICNVIILSFCVIYFISSSISQFTPENTHNTISFLHISTVTVPEIMPCRIDLLDLDAGEGVFGKNNIPQDIIDFNRQHNMPIDCIWAITVKNKWRVSLRFIISRNCVRNVLTKRDAFVCLFQIQLQFQKFSLEKPNDCESNFVEVFSDRTDMPSMEKNFCGSIADTVLSKNNIMFVRFFSEASGMKSYFEANFTAFRENDKSSSESYCETFIFFL